jgi:hypothetical protein
MSPSESRPEPRRYVCRKRDSPSWSSAPPAQNAPPERDRVGVGRVLDRRQHRPHHRQYALRRSGRLTVIQTAGPRRSTSMSAIADSDMQAET